MHSNEWNKEDFLVLRLESPDNPLDRGHEGLNEVLDFVETLDVQLRPDQVDISRKRKPSYSRQFLHEKLHEFKSMGITDIFLQRSCPPNASVRLKFLDETARDDRFEVQLKLRPFSVLREASQTEHYTRALLSLVRAFAQQFPISRGFAHSFTDYFVVEEARRYDEPKPIPEDAYWLNVFGPRLVEQLGHERMLALPAAHKEEFPGGAVLWLTRPTPADFDSEEARQAQARALVHLHPELKPEDTLAALRERSLLFAPLPLQFDEDVADLLRWEVESKGLEQKRKLVERFNAYHPPPVSEWLPAAQAPTPDVPDVQQAIDLYEGQYAEQLIALLAKKVPAVLDGTVDALPQVDYHLWHWGWGRRLPDEEKEILGASLGAWLGMFLVHTLGGRWVPRRALDEAAVVVGDRAWLPFLRARHSLQGREAPLDFSCTQLFRLAQRLARAPSR
jgi:hypothetical protein